jgi:hypothetical protein
LSKVRTSFFEKKEAKKLLAFEPQALKTPGSQDQTFFSYFFSKKVTASSFEGSHK